MAEEKLSVHELVEQTKEYTPVEVIESIRDFITGLRDDTIAVSDKDYLNNLRKLNTLRYYITHFGQAVRQLKNRK